MLNDSLGVIKKTPNHTYIGISKDLDFGINISDIFYGNSDANSTNTCPNISWNDISVWPTVGLVMVAALGILLCLLGYRFLRTSVFIVSVITFSGLVYIICCEVVASSLPTMVTAGSSLLSGLMAGLISILLLWCFGSRVTSVSAGIVMATYLLVMLRLAFQFPLPVAGSLKEAGKLKDIDLPYNEENNTTYFVSGGENNNSLDWSRVFPVAVSLVSMAFCGCVMLVASFLKTKATLVMSTSIVGSAMLGLVADYFTDRHTILTRVSLDCLAVKVSLFGHLCQLDQCCCCWTSWVVLAVVPVMAVVAGLFQWCCTASGIEHELDKLGLVQCGSCGSKRQASIPVLMEPSEKYRHLYRIRRTNGDIISRTHMEAMEVRKSNPSLMLTAARSTSDVVTTTDDDATLVLTQTLDE